MEVDSTEGVVSIKALVKSLEKRKKFIIRPSKPLSKDGVRILSIKDINNRIIIPKIYYKAVNNPVYGW